MEINTHTRTDTHTGSYICTNLFAMCECIWIGWDSASLTLSLSLSLTHTHTHTHAHTQTHTHTHTHTHTRQGLVFPKSVKGHVHFGS
jgi:hypothetical protein